VPNDAPMMIPTARSSTLPRITNALNSFSIEPFRGWRLKRIYRRSDGYGRDHGPSAEEL